VTTRLDLPTPSALIDEQKMSHNIERMQRRIAELGARFRPHVKTSKCLEVVRRQLAAGAQGITVSTLKEAEHFFAAGINDILYAVCLAPNKIEQAASLIDQGCNLTVVVDSAMAANMIATRMTPMGKTFRTMIEIDTDGHRSGVQPQSEELLEIAKVLAGGNTELVGVMTHAGSSYEYDTLESLQSIAEQERQLCILAAERLRNAGYDCPEVSIGSTPTALSARSLEGVTEVRAGVYVFFDLVMTNVGVCNIDNIALSIVTTVIGHQPEKGWAIVDAGWMAMSRDRGTQKQKRDFGYGAVCDISGSVIPGFMLTSANQEHGIVSAENGTAALDITKTFPIGTQLRILPNHACATGAQFPEYQVISNSGTTATWERFYGW
jgi:D-serine deaminase-like pyridoxal phosphate-dependent protein